MGVLELRLEARRGWEDWMASAEGSGLSGVLRRCWTRARALGAQPDGPGTEAVLGDAVLRARREEQGALLRALPEVLAPVISGLSERDYRLLLADRDGVVLLAEGGGAFAPVAEDVRLIAGSTWSEATHGTNAIGTALLEAQPVAVFGAAHFARPNHGLVCYAAPIRDPYGEVRGVLDATSFAAHPSPFAAITVIAAARALEEVLRQQAYARLAPDGGLLRRLLARLPGPALLIERPGHITAANSAALERLHLPALPTLDADGLHRIAAGSRSGLHWASLEAAAHAGQRTVLCGEVATVEPLCASDGRVLAIAAFLQAPTARSATGRRPDPFRRLVGHDPALGAARERARQVAASRLPVMLLAETGTGKELMARAIHDASLRHSHPFVAINCGALPPDLLESELFGHTAHAFTGAAPRGREGRLAEADGGTLFLDEVAEMSPRLQATLLRFLEDGSYHPVGGGPQRRADVRLISATCRDLPHLIAEGTFRQDLYYRLCGAPLTLPPLRERTDLLELAHALLLQVADEEGLPFVPRLSGAATAWLGTQPWPGNIRELKTALHYAAVVASGAAIEPVHFPVLPAAPAPHPAMIPATSADAARSLKDAEQDVLERALRDNDGNISAVARTLGVARSTVYRLMERYSLR